MENAAASLRVVRRSGEGGSFRWVEERERCCEWV
ncbi:hypothetical protein BVRB_026370 [Beta vulgaris subsp. vulgaris]|uniref:Uncharacterized protein n=1 Tax=Beta vulgaris subsp. vulgaris TaxID=3555 RepID=A0A0J8B219_BETVV|nr:hypothetical protein BVRB_026370 [Beta vulgaris subsp. vulgaris]